MCHFEHSAIILRYSPNNECTDCCIREYRIIFVLSPSTNECVKKLKTNAHSASTFANVHSKVYKNRENYPFLRDRGSSI